MLITTKALVIKEQSVGESDRLVTLLTSDLGIIKAFVKRAKLVRSRLNAATSLFAYSDMVLYRGKSSYNVNSAEPIEMFFNLRRDIERLALAQYIAELSGELLTAEQPNEELIRLVLNAFHLLCTGKRKHMQIKAVFEIRALSLTGYMPSPIACESCGTYETDPMFFDAEEGKLYCSSCKTDGLYPLSLRAVTALRLICFGEIVKVFSFTLPDEDLAMLSDAAQRYTLGIIGRTPGTLEFYKGLLKSNPD